jgi:hypothetical protein
MLQLSGDEMTILIINNSKERSKEKSANKKVCSCALDMEGGCSDSKKDELQGD